MTGLDRLLRWTVDPTRREEIAGDLIELHDRRRARLGALGAGYALWRDVASVCVRQSRLLAWARRRPVHAAAALLATALLTVTLAPRTPGAVFRYTVNAVDPLGRFTLDIEGTRVVAATLDGRPIVPERVRQDGRRVVIVGGDAGRDFEIEVKDQGGIRWEARRSRDTP